MNRPIIQTAITLCFAISASFTQLVGELIQNTLVPSSVTSNTVQLLSTARNLNEGIGGYPQFRKAFLMFQQASRQGSTEADAWLGSMYLRGHGVLQDEIKGSELVLKAATQGDPVGTRLAGLLYEEGHTVPQSYVRAKEFYERAASLGDAGSSGRLGMLYLFGRGVIPDYYKARELLEKGSAGGDVWSMIELGQLYLRSPNKADRALAIEQFSNASKRGNRVAAYRLARMYGSGRGTQRDTEQALILLRQSAKSRYVPAEMALGYLYESGRTIQADLERSYAMYTLASRQGNEIATVHLAVMAKKMSLKQISNATALADSYRTKSSTSED